MDGARTLICPILVGRDDLLELADRRLAEARAGNGRFLLLAGEAGLGKSRFLGAVERRAAAEGFATYRGTTYPSDLRVAAAVLMDLARSMSRSPTGRAAGSALAARLDDGASGAGDAHRRRRLLILDVADALASSAAAGPTLIALEDLHWSDDLTLDILAALGDRLTGLPLVLVGTYRSDELYPRVPMREWRSRLVGRRIAEEVRLRRLAPEETAQMATILSGSATPVARDVAAAIHERTDGIPLHVEELLGVLSGPPSVADIVRGADVPDTLDAAVLARLDRRSPRAIEVARAGAVIGRSFDIDLLADVVGCAVEDLSEPLAELADHFLILPTATPGRLAFRHALIGDAIYARVPEPARRRLHERIADAARDRPEVGSAAFLALHHERAGRPAEAHRTALEAAAAAVVLSSHVEARDLYGLALRTAPPDLPAAERAALLRAFAGQAAATDDNAAAAEAYAAAGAAFREAGDPVSAAALAAPLSAVRHLLGDGLHARAALLGAALQEVDARVDGATVDAGARVLADGVRASLRAGLAAAYMLDRRLDEAMVHAAEAGRLASSSEQDAVERHAGTTLGTCEVFAGRMEDGWSRLEAVIAMSRAADLEAEAARAYRMLGSSASVLVEYGRAEHWLREGIAYAERTELWNHRHYMAAHLAHVLWATGRWVDAEAVASHALADGRGGITTRITALHVLGYLALGQGDGPSAASRLGEARELGERMHELQRVSPALWGLAELALQEGDAARAIALTEEAATASEAVADAAYLFPFAVTGTRARLAAADPEGARRWVSRVTMSLERRAIPGTLPAIAHSRGLLALADGRTAQARVDLQAAADAWRDRGRRWEGIWADIDLARAHRRAHRPVDATGHLASARSVARATGATAVLAVVDRLTDEPRGRRRGASGDASASPDAWWPLTAREWEVARLIADGHTNAAVAERLTVSPRTVSAHVEHILAKLGVGRRAEIAAWAARLPVLHSRSHGEDREE